jgi:TPR repeat protein
MSDSVPVSRTLTAALLVALAAALALPGAAHARAEEGKKYALVVGVRDYVSGKFEPLRYTENDAEGLAGVLIDTAGFHSVRVLTSTRGRAKAADAPTAANVRAALKDLLAGRGRHDTVLVALSGHGMQRTVKEAGKDREDNCYCPADAQLNDGATLINLGKLVQDFDECGAGVKLLLVDACRNDPKLGRNVNADTLPRLPRGTAALFSCKLGERAFETPKLGRGHGVFFFHVLQGLRDKAKNERGEVTWGRLVEYVTEAVSDDVPRLIGDGARQTPELKVNLTGKSPVLVRITEAERLFRLALEHRFGQGRRVDWVEGARLYRQAAKAGHPLAGACLGICYWEGTGVTKNEAHARKLVLAAKAAIEGTAEKGSAVAQNLLGNMHFYGVGVEKDYAAALRWYRKAAAQNHPGPQNLIGLCFENGWGVKKDYGEALRWYRKAAEQNHAGGQYNLGVMHECGFGVEKDVKEAARWYRKAAEQNLPSAQNWLGVLYQNGRGVEKDYAEALRWYRKAAEQNISTAQNSLGILYQNGWGVEKDYAEALRWYRKAADQGDANAQNNIGVLSQNGWGVEKDYAEALRWYRKAADQGSAAAQCNLGVMHQNGWGVEKGHKEAVRWYRKAAAQGEAVAQCNLGIMYANSGPAEKYDRIAVRWFRKAAEQGYAAAQNWLGVMYENGRGVEKDHAEALRWYRKAADQGDDMAQYNIGLMYENGKGVERDLGEARKWYSKAAARGNEGARKRLGELEGD